MNKEASRIVAFQQKEDVQKMSTSNFVDFRALISLIVRSSVLLLMLEELCERDINEWLKSLSPFSTGVSLLQRQPFDVPSVPPS